MREFKLPKRTLLLWQIRFALIWISLSAVCYLVSLKFELFLVIIAIFTVLCLVAIFLYLPKYHSGFKIKCLKDAVVVENGVIVKRCHILPFSRLIYSQTINTPLSKSLGITAVTMKAARSFIFIPELLDNDSKELLTILIKGDAL